MNENETALPLPAREFIGLGLERIAYVKAITEGSGTVFAVYAADGTQMAVMPSRELAFAAIRQNNLEPLSVH
ncbi:MAG: DUF1150 family protein [Kiloniellaceae bacterium]